MPTESDACLALYIAECPGYTGPRTVVEKVECWKNTECAEPPLGDRHIWVAREFLVCGHVVLRKVVKHLLECCCDPTCWPSPALIDCVPCDTATTVPGTITGTISTGGQCACVEGDHELEFNGANGWETTFEACGTTWTFGLFCIDGDWYVKLTCGPCPWEFDADNPIDPPPCAIWISASVSSCEQGSFSGSASGGELFCFNGSCPGLSGPSFTFSG